MSNIPARYIVVSVRKSDGTTYFPDNPRHRKGIDDYQTALEIAKRKARELSPDYYYAVYQCTPVAVVEKDLAPLKVTEIYN